MVKNNSLKIRILNQVNVRGPCPKDSLGENQGFLQSASRRVSEFKTCKVFNLATLARKKLLNFNHTTLF